MVGKREEGGGGTPGRGETGVRTTSPLLRFQAGIDLRVALGAMPLRQLYGEVRVAQLCDEIFRHRDPLAGPGAVDHVVKATILNESILPFMGHGYASAGRGRTASLPGVTVHGGSRVPAHPPCPSKARGTMRTGASRQPPPP
jgi:hypothetical protein